MDLAEQTDKDAALSILAAAEKRRRKHTSDRDMAVQLARGRGASWTEIGVTLGISRQAARQGFSIAGALATSSTDGPGAGGLWDE